MNVTVGLKPNICIIAHKHLHLPHVSKGLIHIETVNLCLIMTHTAQGK